MATIAIIHGGADSGMSWGPCAQHMRELGHDPVPVDLPIDDPKAGWSEYADAVAAAVRGKGNIVVVAHSLGGFTAPLVCDRVPVQRPPRAGSCLRSSASRPKKSTAATCRTSPALESSPSG